MRILIVTSQFPIAGEPHRGRPVYQTVRELSRLAEVKVLSPIATYPGWARPRSYLYRPAEHQAVAPGCDVDYVTYPALPAVSRPFNGHLCARALSRPVRAFAPDVVLAYWLYPDGYGALRAAREAGVPFLAGARGSDLRVRDAVSRRLTRPVVRAARRLLVVSEDLGRVAAEQYGADPERIRAIPNGCDAALFRPGDRQAARAALGLAQDAEVVLYVGRLVPEKGLRELVHATRRLLATRPRARVVLVGDGPLYAELAATLAAEPALPLQLAGSQAPAEVARWMVASDLVTLPSYSEGHPNVLVEALACGRPVVATPVGGIPEVVDAASGLLVPARDADALADALAEALAQDWDEAALARRFSRDWEQVARDTLLACEEALAERTGPARAAYAAGSA
ncbi:glycosyltransferase [Pseudoxanthomonas sp. F37]|jgi:teichuronic acid biosynthesis glycosyltransferase TuaC|uniref:glycosyltransferase n=1 Tax=Pseudoxanthomonas TaxID=83618 RepID=UPI001FD0D531|nr:MULTISPECIES: glycosyltransferase [Pseudoxanthomonas]UOV04922.1 glycosyltransferase [Pseudoxanthomonas mexicana]UOV09929.1 glycosyltransferase [Pseudoxanthomonas sp. F37]